jgi:hypothetical protein
MKYFASLTGSRAKRAEADRRRDTFTQQIEAQGKTAHQVSTVEELPAPAEIAAHLGLEAGQPIGVRRRIMYADSEPLQLGDSFYPLDIVGGTKMMRPADIVEGTDQVLEETLLSCPGSGGSASGSGVQRVGRAYCTPGRSPVRGSGFPAGATDAMQGPRHERT